MLAVFAAVVVLFYATAFWLLAGFVVLSAGVGFADAGAFGAASSALFMFIAGVVVLAIRRSAKAFWRVERDRWDSRDLPPDPR